MEVRPGSVGAEVKHVIVARPWGAVKPTCGAAAASSAASKFAENAQSVFAAAEILRVVGRDHSTTGVAGPCLKNASLVSHTAKRAWQRVATKVTAQPLRAAGVRVRLVAFVVLFLEPNGLSA